LSHKILISKYINSFLALISKFQSNTKAKAERSMSKDLFGMGNYDGLETHDLSKDNLANAEEKVLELTRLAESQKQEIERLRAELQNYQNNYVSPIGFQGRDYNILTEQVLKAEENQNHLLEIIKQKGTLIVQLLIC